MVNGKMRTKEKNKGRAKERSKERSKERDTGCNPRRNKRQVLLAVLLAVVLILAVGTVYYVNDYYRSDVDLAEYQKGSGSVKVTEVKDGLFLDGPASENSMIFYPGAKV